MAMDVAAALNEELRDLQAAGCDVARDRRTGDDPLPRKSFRLRRQSSRSLPRRHSLSPRSFISATAIPAAPDNSMNTNYPELLSELMKTKIGGFGVEFTRSNFDPAVLAVAKGRIIMFGCVDPSDTPVPSVASVVERVRTALKYIEPEKSLARSGLRLDDDWPRPGEFQGEAARRRGGGSAENDLTIWFQSESTMRR